jgi:hypothetical protein
LNGITGEYEYGFFDDEEETSPGDIEEDPDDLPANDLITLRNAAVADMEID